METCHRSFTKGQTVILTEADIREEALCSVIGSIGYQVLGVSKAPYEKKGLFGFGK